MTDCYYILLASIQGTDQFIVRMFLYSLSLVITYPVLGWTPEPMRRYARIAFLALGLIGAYAWIAVVSLIGLPMVDLPACAF